MDVQDDREGDAGGRVGRKARKGKARVRKRFLRVVICVARGDTSIRKASNHNSIEATSSSRVNKSVGAREMCTVVRAGEAYI